MARSISVKLRNKRKISTIIQFHARQIWVKQTIIKRDSTRAMFLSKAQLYTSYMSITLLKLGRFG